MKIVCPHCGANLDAPADRIGKRVKCVRCKEQFVVEGEPVASISAKATPSDNAPPHGVPVSDRTAMLNDCVVERPVESVSRSTTAWDPAWFAVGVQRIVPVAGLMLIPTGAAAEFSPSSDHASGLLWGSLPWPSHV